MPWYPAFERFARERQYVNNVSPSTLEWYRWSLRCLPVESPTQEDLKDLVVQLRERGLSASGVNCKARAINAYLKWAGLPVKIPKLKEEQRILPTFSLDDVRKIVKHKPKGFYRIRAHVFLLTLLDTGCRRSEALGLRWDDVDFDNLLIKLHGKGRKDRLVPFSFELRRQLYRWHQLNRWDIVFPTQQGQWLEKRNSLRGVHCLCGRLGITPPERLLHAARHSFAVNYLRRGGSVFHLQKVLGHSTLEMTRRYANLMTEDLQAVHERVSLLSFR